MHLQNLKVYVLNLDRRPDRWETASKTLKRAGFTNVERVPAIDGKLIDSQQLKKLVSPSVYSTLGKVRKNHEDLGSVGAVGCYLSHYKVWNQIIESNEPAIVVEDDVLCHPLLNEFELSKDASPLKNFDFVLLASELRERNLLPRPNTQGVYPYHGMFFQTHFYYLTPQGAQFFASKALPIAHQVDSYMAFQIKQFPEFRSAVHLPNMATQSDSTTDIQTMMEGNIPFTQVWVALHRSVGHSSVVCGLIYGTVGLLLFYILAKMIQIVGRD